MSGPLLARLGQAVRALLPRPCPGCGAQLGTQAGLCTPCRAALTARVDRHSPLRARPEAHLLTLGSYSGPRRRAVRALKYAGVRELAGVLGAALAAGVPAEWGVRAVVAVPLHPTRQRERGFNQAELLARALAAELGVPCVNALRRTQAGAQQARRRAAQREDLRGAFERSAALLPPGAVLLVDDVFTSGGTALACQEALLGAGVPAVYLAVIAR